MGRPPIRKSGAIMDAERAKRYRRKVARALELANPNLVAKRERRRAREVELGAKIMALPDRRYGVIYADPEWHFEPYPRVTG
jgi:hypothetical protein